MDSLQVFEIASSQSLTQPSCLFTLSEKLCKENNCINACGCVVVVCVCVCNFPPFFMEK